ncbi:MAG: hypothetical protein N0E58_04705 [Candidatus Thiodiazotropha endolucinida]|uniref:Uncharacterized protein n=1 Tax=Candidatus Thiodiazotropha taylori TaxID=2792791 RepID=A0A9E4TRQ4_9GAMM|nr:hypothetical protein [Candidatus Thiodiazotropha taylori]MCW4235550.1 hypothetical protein [Candidatus Thiodiazotropha endolucinida]
MTHEEFLKEKVFMFTDIRSEVALANTSDTKEGKIALSNLGISPGVGNFMAALALLSYTEFGGKLKYGHKKKNGTDYASKNFNDFFDQLGTEYSDFRNDEQDVYDIFRCGLAHEYYIKKNCTISMSIEPENKPGIGLQGDGSYYFSVEPYCRDLERAFIDLEKHLYK